jgi:hypothetical protein
MKKSGGKNILLKEDGMASIEATVLAVIFVTMIYYIFGFFGVVHTGLLHNIHARTYAFETFRHRVNLMYFRSNNAQVPQHFYNTGVRLHGINTDAEAQPATQKATERPIIFGQSISEEGRRVQTHNSEIFQRVPASGRNRSVSVNPVWIMTLYGICLNNGCGG